MSSKITMHVSFLTINRSGSVKYVKRRSFGEAIKFVRDSRKLTQNQMADLMDVSLRYYQTLEKDDSSPSSEVLATVLEKTKLSYEVFFGLPKPDTQKINPDEIARAVTALVEAGPVQLNTVLFLLLGDEAYLRKLPARFRQNLESLSAGS